MESRGSVAGMLAAAVFAASMALAVRVLMMVAMHGRVEIQRAVHQGFRRSIRIPADAAEQADARIGQGDLCAAADAAADQRIHAALHQEARQRAVPAAVGIHDFGTDDLPVLYIVELELRRAPEVLENLPVFISGSECRQHCPQRVDSCPPQRR